MDWYSFLAYNMGFIGQKKNISQAVALQIEIGLKRLFLLLFVEQCQILIDVYGFGPVQNQK